jgi:signal transduction histidine kinase
MSRCQRTGPKPLDLIDEVVVHVRACPNHLEIVVRDTGRGISEEMLRRLGTPFFTTREHGAAWA